MAYARRNVSRFIRSYRDSALIEQGGICYFCHCPLRRIEATADHMKPVVKGGADTKENIVACCKSCNKAKGGMSIHAFRKIVRGQKMPAGDLVIAWASYRIGKRTEKACRRILESVGAQ